MLRVAVLYVAVVGVIVVGVIMLGDGCCYIRYYCNECYCVCC